MALKNIWSLNVDEALAADAIRKNVSKKSIEVFFPVNSQLKNIDLVVFDLKRRKSKTVQVKGSRTYDPKRIEIERYGNGANAWIVIDKEAIFHPDNPVDTFIFVIHSSHAGITKQEFSVNYLVVPIKRLQAICKKKPLRIGNKYHFIVWTDTVGKRVFDINSKIGKPILLTKYLDAWELLGK